MMSTSLRERIFQAISREDSSSISFADYMACCLYDVEQGYYADPASRRLGGEGDFFTSVSVGAGFGFFLGLAAEARWNESGGESFLIVEQGAHDGQLARDILAGLEERESPLREALRYVIHEPRDPQAGRLKEAIQGFPIEVASKPPETRAPRGLYLCNELLDAFPVHRIRWEAGEWRELRVGIVADQLSWCPATIEAGTALSMAVERIAPRDWPEGYTTEICLALEAWAATASSWFDEGHWWVIDYGREADDYFDPSRHEGTLRGYRNHQRCDDPFESPGEIDLTADVNFTDVIAALSPRRATLVKLTDQHHFLIRVAEAWLRGIEAGGPEALASNQKRLRQFQTLTHPGLMGRAFKVADFRREGTGSGGSDLKG